MMYLSLTPNEVTRLKDVLDKIPDDVVLTFSREVTSEFGYSVFVKYLNKMEWNSIDITSTDNF